MKKCVKLVINKNLEESVLLQVQYMELCPGVAPSGFVIVDVDDGDGDDTHEYSLHKLTNS